MSGTTPTIVVRFGQGAAGQDLFLVELDGQLNREIVDGVDQEKTQFYPGDEIHFLLHYDQTKYRVTAIKATAGQVQMASWVDRTQEEELLFEVVGEAVELSHYPSRAPVVTWYGRTASLSRVGRSLAADSAPCLGLVTYPYRAWSGKLVPPPVDLEDGEEYPLAIVVYVEAAEP
jgi:hypothetical protein